MKLFSFLKLKIILIMAVLSCVLSFSAWASQPQDITQKIVPIIMFLLEDDTPEVALQPLRHRAVLNGPLSDSKIEVYLLSQGSNIDLIESTRAQKSRSQYAASGTFDLNVEGAAYDQWLLVSASEGEDIDHDANLILDNRPTAFGGKLHALAPAEAWRDGNLVVSPLTELVWRYTENIIPLIHIDELSIRLDEIARALFDSDLNGDDIISYADVLDFDPFNQDHIDHLSIDFAWFNLLNNEDTSIISTLLEGNVDAQLQRIQQLFDYLLLLNPVLDSRYQSIAIGLSVFGMGHGTTGIKKRFRRSAF